MKRLLALFMAFALVMALAGCGAAEEKPSAPAQESQPEITEKSPASAPAEEKARDLPTGDYEEIGEGNAYIATAGGTSENGNIPVIYAEKDLILKQIGLNAFDFDGSLISCIYIDGMLADKQQLANTQTSIDLTGEQLAEGVHTVEVVQYENNDPAAAMTLYRLMQYEIKPM